MNAASEGPWKIGKGVRGRITIRDASGNVPAVAQVLDAQGSQGANARLIAAAPDLLAALKSAQGLLALSDVAHLMGQLGEQSALHGTLNEISKALRKAGSHE